MKCACRLRPLTSCAFVSYQRLSVKNLRMCGLCAYDVCSIDSDDSNFGVRLKAGSNNVEKATYLRAG